MEVGGLPLAGGEGVVLFEVAEGDELGPILVADEAKAVANFEEALERVRPAVVRVLATLQELAPGAVEVEFGLKLTGRPSTDCAEAELTRGYLWAPGPNG